MYHTPTFRAFASVRPRQCSVDRDGSWKEELPTMFTVNNTIIRMNQRILEPSHAACSYFYDSALPCMAMISTRWMSCLENMAFFNEPVKSNFGLSICL